MRRYPIVGGVAAWRLPVLTAALALAGFVLDAREIAVAVVVLGWVGHQMWRSVVVEVSPDGLARGFALEGGLVGPTASMSWGSVVAVDTDWWHPGDHRALETSVRSRDGTTIRISTAMGLQSYWACLADVVRLAPGAVRSGLTDATLADGPPARRDLIAAAKTAGTLALILGGMVALFYVLAQGRSSLARYLEEAAPLPPSLREGCRPGAPGVEAPGPPGRCEPRPEEARPLGL